MSELLTFVAENPWQTFFLGPFVFAVLLIVFFYAAVFYTKLLRSINILFRGWPPSHLDADGDFRPMKEREEELRP